ncbi:MAG: hypothetical protein MJZ36_04190 [Bacteroidaceae bacterium]|nr:hypothetical protein [Bacteroidaceae bacterium]
MKKLILMSALVLASGATFAQKKGKTNVPYVYKVENTGASYASPVLPKFEDLPIVKDLPNPLEWSDGSGVVTDFKDWSRRRAEIAKEIQHYEIGEKPAVGKEQVKARMSGDTLIVDVTVGSNTITLTSVITYPTKGKAPYPLMIGTSHISLPGEVLHERPLALMTYNERQVNGYSQFRGNTDRTTYPFVKLYPQLIDNGAYSEWAWGLSRLIDGLQQLGPKVTKIDTEHIGVTGCSYAGKMALFCGAFDERIALTIAQEPGGGGAAAWRVSHTMEEVENLDKTDYHWFMESLKEQFHDDNVYRLPYDHHELCAMVCPRALLVLGNPDYKWLADESARQSMEAASKVWQKFGIEDRVGLSIVAGHPHCQVPESQYEIIGNFIDRFLIKK